jgi:hypothetical protein
MDWQRADGVRASVVENDARSNCSGSDDRRAARQDFLTLP